MTLAILAGSASIAAAYRKSINRPAMTPPTLSGNARCTRSARHPHPSCEAKQLGGRSDQPRPTDAAVIPIEPAAPTVPPLPAISCLGAFPTPAAERVEGLVIAGVRKPAQNRTFTPWPKRGRASSSAVIRLRRRDRQGGTHIPGGRSASSTAAFPRKVDRFLQRFAILCSRKASSESPPWL